VRRLASLVLGALLASSPSARAQSLIIDVTQHGGYSTDEVAALAVQARALAETSSHMRFNVETAWASRSETTSDAFGAAYPYGNRVQLIEAYGERMFLPGAALFGIRVGRYRTPFGISSGSDHGYGGFLRAPLIRYDGYYALSNNFLEHGVDVIVGRPRLSFEVSAGAPADVGTAVRRHGLDLVMRGQAAFGSTTLGASYIATDPYQPETYAHGRAVFAGLDGRWMHAGIQVRGEWLAGRPFDGTTTTGGYLDVAFHRPGMGPVTAMLRAERLDYETEPPHAMHAIRYSAAGRIRLLNQVSAQVALVHNVGYGYSTRATALDLGLTYSVRPH